MERLGTRHYRTTLEFLGDLYTSATIERFPARLVENLHKLIPCEWTFCGRMDPDHGISIHSASPAEAFTPELSQKLWVPVMHEHPPLMRARLTGDLGACRVSDFLSQSKFHRTALYNEYYRKLAIEDSLCKAIHVGGSVILGCSFQRKRRNFTDEDRLMFDLIGPHLGQAWRNAQTMTQLLQQTAAMAKGLEALEYGVIVLSLDGRVRSMTAGVRGILEEFFGDCPPSDHYLPDLLARWIGKQKEQYPATDLAQPQTPLMVKRGESRLVVRLVRNSSRDLLLLQVQSVDRENARLNALPLTQREKEVLTWVARGKTNEDIGLILHISHRTVQKHLEHVFAKLGVETRTAAAATILDVDSGLKQSYIRKRVACIGTP